MESFDKNIFKIRTSRQGNLNQ